MQQSHKSQRCHHATASVRSPSWPFMPRPRRRRQPLPGERRSISVLGNRVFQSIVGVRQHMRLGCTWRECCPINDEQINSQQARGRPRKTIHIFHVCLRRMGVPPRTSGGTPQTSGRATVTDTLQSTTFRLYSSAAAPVTGDRCQGTKCRPGTTGILKYVIRSRSFLRKGIELSNTVS